MKILIALGIISCLLYSSCAAPTTSLQSDERSPLNITKRNEGIINGLFGAYACRINKVLELVQNKLAPMAREQCARGPLPVLPADLHQRYHQLTVPQCFDAVNVLVYLYKLVPYLYDAQIRDIVCHLNTARTSLNQVNFYSEGSYCPSFTPNELMQIYDQWDLVYHAPDTMYCMLTSLSHHIPALLRREIQGTATTNSEAVPCNIGLCST